MYWSRSAKRMHPVEFQHYTALYMSLGLFTMSWVEKPPFLRIREHDKLVFANTVCQLMQTQGDLFYVSLFPCSLKHNVHIGCRVWRRACPKSEESFCQINISTFLFTEDLPVLVKCQLCLQHSYQIQNHTNAFLYVMPACFTQILYSPDSKNITNIPSTNSKNNMCTGLD